MGRKRKDFTRKSGVRDATLFVIATEGEVTEKQYFETLVSKEHYFSTRVHVEIMPTTDGKSAPNKVLARLDDFRKEYNLRRDDELWVVVDRDRRSWTIQAMAEAQQRCRQKGYTFGLTNPCFEFWLLLHVEDPADYSEETIEDIRTNRKHKRRSYCERRLRDRLGTYNKSNPDIVPFMPHVTSAIDRNRALTQNGEVDLFNRLGSSLDILVERLIEQAAK